MPTTPVQVLDARLLQCRWAEGPSEARVAGKEGGRVERGGEGQLQRRDSLGTTVRTKRRTWSRSFLALPVHAFQVCLRRGSSSSPGAGSNGVGCASSRRAKGACCGRGERCGSGARSGRCCTRRTGLPVAMSSAADSKPRKGDAPPPLERDAPLPSVRGCAQAGREGARTEEGWVGGGRRAWTPKPSRKSGEAVRRRAKGRTARRDDAREELAHSRLAERRMVSSACTKLSCCAPRVETGGLVAGRARRGRRRPFESEPAGAAAATGRGALRVR